MREKFISKETCMMIASKRALKRRLLPLLLAALLILLTLPQTALAATFSAVVTAQSMPVYADATLTQQIGALGTDEVVLVGAYQGNVALIRHPSSGGVGYARVSDMAAVNASAQSQTATVIVSSRFYQQANAASAYLAVEPGYTVNVLAVNGEWAQVERLGLVGYMYVSALSIGGQQATATPTPAPTQSAAISATVTAGSMYVYSSPSTAASRYGVIYQGETVEIIQQNGDWAFITRNGCYGYCLLSGLSVGGVAPTPTPTQNTGSVVTETFTAVALVNTYVYSAASASSAVLGGLYAGTQVTVHMYDSTWAYISLNGNYGYCPIAMLQRVNDSQTDPLEGYIPVNLPSTVVANTALYADDDASASTLATLNTGDVITVTAYNLQWAYATVNGQNGFVPLRHLLSDAQAVVGEMGAMVTRDAQVYEACLAASASVGYVTRGSVLTVLAYSYGCGFAYVRNETDGSTGYVSLSALTPYATPAPSEEPEEDGTLTATVTVDSMYVYSAPSTSASRYGLIYRGEQVQVLEYNSTWAFITRNGNYGYCLLAGLTANTSGSQPSEGTQFQATVVYPGAPFFQSASTSSAYVTAPLGTTVDVYAYSGGWAYVGANGMRGYMLISHLSRNNYATLSNGSSGSAVLSLQQALEMLGYFDGVPAGNYSSLTQTAVARFQSAVGLNATGVADEITQRILYGGYSPASPLLSLTLAIGSTGDNVTRLQTRLYHKGYLSLASSVDGDYGNNTASAVALFQAAAGLNATGVADSYTLYALYSNMAPANPGGSADTGGGSSDPVLPSDPDRDQKIEYVIAVAQQQMGKPYVYGATGPDKFDCSGFTTYCYKQVGVTFGRTAQQQGYGAGTKIEGLDNLVRGDIVCMNTVSDNDLSDHVGIYLGNKQMIHASSGAGEVIVSDLSRGYYNRVFSWGRRVL